MPHSPYASDEHSVSVPKYTTAARNIETRVKEFLSDWHGEAKDLRQFAPQEFDLMIEDGRYEELLSAAKDLQKSNISEFNRDFFGLFKDILLVPTPGNGYVPNKELLWAAILEAKSPDEETNSSLEPSVEEFHYSLFCFVENQKNPSGFFVTHRKYKLLDKDPEKKLIGLTDVILHKSKKTTNGGATRQRKEDRFKPLYVGVRPDASETAGKPYKDSIGILLDQKLTDAVDSYLNEPERIKLLRDGDEQQLLNAIVDTYKNVLEGASRKFFQLSESAASVEEVRTASGDIRFVYYLIWLRAMGVAGEAKKNWVDYFYFRVPDLSGYLHTFTIASQNQLDETLFELIDRKAPSLFHRSLLRLAVREKDLARRAAVVAVMSRNMSHNIGSHVLAGLTKKEQFEHAGLDDVATLNSYLQTRMDFLADLATSLPFVTLPKRLYKDICIYLTPSIKKDDVVSWQKLLMDRISGSTAVKRDNIKLIVTVGNQGKVSLKTVALDPILASPNDMLGAHALYVILENMIRNSAKHSLIESELQITVSVFEEDDDYWRVKMFDNLGECNRQSGPGESPLEDRLQKGIDQQILNPNASLRLGNWGLLEMKIAAAYLRKISPTEIDDEQKPPLLKAINHQGNLGYEFYLLRPKGVLLIESKGDSFDKFATHVEPFGINVVKDIKLYLASRDARHDFLIVDSPTKEQEVEIKNHSEMLPSRIFKCVDSPVDKRRELNRLKLLKYFEKGAGDTLRTYLWRQWVAAATGDPQFPSIKLATNEGPKLLLGKPDQPAKETIFFDNHGKYGETLTPDEVLYYEPYETKSPTGLLLSRLPVDKLSRQTLLYELIEAARLRVVVVDERVQHESIKPCPVVKTRSNRQVLAWMRIMIPQIRNQNSSDGVIDLNKQKFEPNDRRALEAYLEPLSKSSDVLLIHLGVVEKLLGSTEITKIDGWLSEWKDKFPALVVTSGRGRPSNLPAHMRFLHYSLVGRYIFQERSKYHLCKVIFASRRLAQ